MNNTQLNSEHSYSALREQKIAEYSKPIKNTEEANPKLENSTNKEISSYSSIEKSFKDDLRFKNILSDKILETLKNNPNIQVQIPKDENGNDKLIKDLNDLQNFSNLSISDQDKLINAYINSKTEYNKIMDERNKKYTETGISLLDNSGDYRNSSNYLKNQISNSNFLVDYENFSTSALSFSRNNFFVNKYYNSELLEPATTGRPWIFFTKPACNPSGSDKIHITSDQEIKSILTDFLSGGEETGSGPNKFIPFLTNFSTDIDIINENTATFKVFETPEDACITLPEYSGHDEINSGNIAITYNDLKGLPILKIHKVWMEYYNLVYKGYIDPKDELLKKNIIDYFASIYVFLVGPDNRSILYWEKYVGVFPTTLPYSTLKSDSGIDKLVKYQIQYAYNFKVSMDSKILDTFNSQMGNNNPKIEQESSDIRYQAHRSYSNDGKTMTPLSNDSKSDLIASKPYIASDSSCVYPLLCFK
jgi:hypothetical protein